MSYRLRHRIVAALAAISLTIPFAARATLSSESRVTMPPADDASTFLAAAIAQERALPLAAVSPLDATGKTVQFVQSAPALRNPLSASLRSSSDAALWNFVAMVHSLQTSQDFDTVDTRVSAVLTLAPPVAAVPLPGMTWLMVITLLGFAGAGTLRRKDEAAPSELELRNVSVAT